MELAIELTLQLGDNTNMPKAEIRTKIINIISEINLKTIPDDDLDEFVATYITNNLLS